MTGTCSGCCTPSPGCTPAPDGEPVTLSTYPIDSLATEVRAGSAVERQRAAASGTGCA